MLTSVCVFCGSSSGRNAEHVTMARAVGSLLGSRRVRVVYGGGGAGLMGTVADAALAAGGEVIGVIPRKLVDRELAHPGVTELLTVDTMHERKAKMASLSDAFLVLAGGIGTLEELFEVWSWAQLGFHRKPIGVLNVAGYFDPLRDLMQHACEGGFVRSADLEILHMDDDPERLLATLDRKSS
jgi:uncharacterized protein (TIGR00730 family)